MGQRLGRLFQRIPPLVAEQKAAGGGLLTSGHGPRKGLGGLEDFLALVCPCMEPASQMPEAGGSVHRNTQACRGLL